MAAAGRFEFATSQEIAIKGHKDPKPVFSDPSERRSAQSETHGFVGRERDPALITTQLDETQASLRRAARDDAASLLCRTDAFLKELDLSCPPLWSAQEGLWQDRGGDGLPSAPAVGQGRNG